MPRSLLVSIILSVRVFTAQTYLGLADCDDVAIGPGGDLYLSCHSPSDRLSIEVNAFERSRGGMEAYVLRYNPKTEKLVYATRIAGADYDNAIRIKVDQHSFAYSTGFTKSKDFKITADAIQRKYAGGDSDAFLVKLAPDGKVIYSTFIGGSGTDQGNGLEIDHKGNIYVAGTTWSSDFPGQSKPKMGTQGDAFITSLRAGGKDFRSVVFGGKEEEKLTGIALDNNGSIYATGYSKSADFPSTSALKGVRDMFLTRISVADLSMQFSALVGGSEDDSAWGIAIPPKGDPVVAGITSSADFPISSHAYQTTKAADSDAFVIRFDRTNLHKFQSTYFGGAKNDSSGYDGGNIKIDPHGNIWIVGITSSPELPGAKTKYLGGETDGFLAAFSPDLGKLCISGLFGGPGRDLLEGLALSDEHVFAVGISFSSAPSAIPVGDVSVNSIVVKLPLRTQCR
ncbi:MAG TPA: SBBP repeat-containing protein [Bryobacteraceae bacterium]|nr:SBBP repeat-containing protein [Bryobacteraceae bacterium]